MNYSENREDLSKVLIWRALRILKVVATGLVVFLVGEWIRRKWQNFRYYFRIMFNGAISENLKAQKLKKDEETEERRHSRSAKFDTSRSRGLQQGYNYYDLIIIGAGTAGCTLALQISELTRKKANKKLHILILEKDFETPDRIIGELMQPLGVEILREMNIVDCLTADQVDAVPSIGYEIHMPGRDENQSSSALLFYPIKQPQKMSECLGYIDLQNSKKLHGVNRDKLTGSLVKRIRKMIEESSSTSKNDEQINSALLECNRNSPIALCFHNSRFVKQLRGKLGNYDNIDFIEGEAVNMIYLHDLNDEERNFLFDNVEVCGIGDQVVGVEILSRNVNSKNNAHNTGIHKIFGKLTCLCDGGASFKLRKTYNKRCTQKLLSTWIGVLMQHNEWETPLENAALSHVILCTPSPVLMYQISKIETRCLVCVDIDLNGDRESYYRYLHDTILPQLPSAAIKSAFLAAINSGKFCIKNAYTMSAKSTSCAGLIAVGDSFNMRHAITGCGMSVILNLIMNENLSDSYASFRISVNLCKKRRNVAGTLNTLANALHDVFTIPSEILERSLLRDACFKYLKRGGIYSAGPIGLLSGLSSRPIILAFHFFCVVFYAIKILIQNPKPNWDNYISHWCRQMGLIYSVLHEGIKIFLPYAINDNVTFLSKWPIRCFIKSVFPYEES